MKRIIAAGSIAALLSVTGATGIASAKSPSGAGSKGGESDGIGCKICKPKCVVW